MLTITNDMKSVATYVVKEINGSSYIERKANELYQLNLEKEPETIIDVMQMVTEMYYDFIWTNGYAENTEAKMDIELKQYIEESIDILKL